MVFNSKLIISLLSLASFALAYIDQPCFPSGNVGEGACVKKSTCIISTGQEGTAKTYSGLCPNDPTDVLCCIKTLTKLKDGTSKSGRCINANNCKTETVSGQCPGNNVKLCVTETSNKCSVNGVSGTCMNPNNCKGTVYSGYCSGGNDNKCCVPTSVSEPGNCPTPSNPDKTKSGKSKIAEALEQIFGNEGGCQNQSTDSGNKFDGKIGYSCMGVTPSVGWNNRSKYYSFAISKCEDINNKANFVKCAHDLDLAKFKSGTESLYKKDYADIGGCTNLPQPAYYICFDTAVNQGPGWSSKTVKNNPIGNSDGKTYGLKLNELSRAYLKSLKNPTYEKGWMNRCDNREKYCNNYC